MEALEPTLRVLLGIYKATGLIGRYVDMIGKGSFLFYRFFF
jgi:hypothetical protein